MLTKGILKSIDFTSNTCVVRMPLFENSNEGEEICATAIISNQPGAYNGFKEGDVVIVGFETDKIDQPIVLGKLFLGTQEEDKDARGTLNCNTLTVDQNATIPITTKLSFDSSNETMAGVKGSYGSFKTLTDIVDALQVQEKAIGTTQAQLIDTGEQLGLQVKKMIDLNNYQESRLVLDEESIKLAVETASNADKTANKALSEIVQTSTKIDMKVNKEYDNADEQFGWTLQSNGWVIYQAKDYDEATLNTLKNSALWITYQNKGDDKDNKYYIQINGASDTNPDNGQTEDFYKPSDSSYEEILNSFNISKGTDNKYYWTYQLPNNNQIFITNIEAVRFPVLTVDGDGLRLNGHVEADSGHIGGFTISQKNLVNNSTDAVRIYSNVAAILTDGRHITEHCGFTFSDAYNIYNNGIGIKTYGELSYDTGNNALLSFTGSLNELGLPLSHTYHRVKANITITLHFKYSTKAYSVTKNGRTTTYPAENIDEKVDKLFIIGNYLDNLPKYNSDARTITIHNHIDKVEICSIDSITVELIHYMTTEKTESIYSKTFTEFKQTTNNIGTTYTISDKALLTDESIGSSFVESTGSIIPGQSYVAVSNTDVLSYNFYTLCDTQELSVTDSILNEICSTLYEDGDKNKIYAPCCTPSTVHLFWEITDKCSTSERENGFFGTTSSDLDASDATLQKYFGKKFIPASRGSYDETKTYYYLSYLQEPYTSGSALYRWRFLPVPPILSGETFSRVAAKQIEGVWLPKIYRFETKAGADTIAASGEKFYITAFKYANPDTATPEDQLYYSDTNPYPISVSYFNYAGARPLNTLGYFTELSTASGVYELKLGDMYEYPWKTKTISVLGSSELSLYVSRYLSKFLGTPEASWQGVFTNYLTATILNSNSIGADTLTLCDTAHAKSYWLNTIRNTSLHPSIQTCLNNKKLSQTHLSNNTILLTGGKDLDRHSYTAPDVPMNLFLSENYPTIKAVGNLCIQAGESSTIGTAYDTASESNKDAYVVGSVTIMANGQADDANEKIQQVELLAYDNAKGKDVAAITVSTKTGSTKNPASTTENKSYAGHIVIGSKSYKDSNPNLIELKGITYVNENVIAASDKRLKYDINSLDTTPYDRLFDLLQPVSYKFSYGESQRQHLGFIAQEVETAIQESGLTNKNFAGLVKIRLSPDSFSSLVTGTNTEKIIFAPNDLDENGDAQLYTLRYEEFIALNTMQIQKLKQRINSLEQTISELSQKITSLEAKLK